MVDLTVVWFPEEMRFEYGEGKSVAENIPSVGFLEAQ
jgi:hypothetical protein